MKKTSDNPSRLSVLSLPHLNPEEALRLFIQVKPEKIEAEIKKLKTRKGKKKND